MPWTPDRRKVAVQGQYCRGISTDGSLGENRERLAGRMVEGGRGTPSVVGSRVRLGSGWLRNGGGEGDVRG